MQGEVKIITEKLYDENTEKPWGWRINFSVPGCDPVESERKLQDFFEQHSIDINAYFCFSSREEAEEELRKGLTVVKDQIVLWRAKCEAISGWIGITEEVI